MAERVGCSPNFRWFGLSLLVLVVLAAYNHSLHPLVRGFGLAHARVVETASPPILLVNSLTADSAPVVQEIFPVKIWGGHHFGIHQILVPWLALAVALGVLSFLAAAHLEGAAARLRRSHSVLIPPPASLWAGLGTGAVLALQVGSAGWSFPPELALVPFVLAVLAVAIVSLRRGPRAEGMGLAFLWLSATRWFWLGFLVCAWVSDYSLSNPRGSVLVDGMFTAGGAPQTAQAVDPWILCQLVVAFSFLHAATRAPRTADLSRFSGDRQTLLATCDRLTLLTIHELWFLLPPVVVAVGVLHEPVLLDRLGPYLLSSAVCAVLMKWTLQGHPPARPTWMDRLKGSLCRIATIVLVLAWPATIIAQAFFQVGKSTWVTAPLIMIALGLVRGQPWSGRRPLGDFAVQLEQAEIVSKRSSSARRKLSAGGKLASVGAVAALLIAFSSATRQDKGYYIARPVADGAFAATESKLEESFGHRLRLVRNVGGTLLLSQSLNGQEQALAERMVRAELPDERVRSVSVRLGTWEASSVVFLALGMAAIAYATLANGRGVLFHGLGGCRAALLGLAGANGAFAVGAWWGWYWLDPWPHCLVFALCTALCGRTFARPPGPVTSTLQSEPETRPQETVVTAAPPPGASKPVESTRELLTVDVLAIEVGRSLVPLIDPAHGAKLLERVHSVRRHIASELGVLVPGIRFRDDLQLQPQTYVIKVNDLKVGEGTLRMGEFLAIGPQSKVARLPGQRMADPTYGMPGVWITAAECGSAEEAGCMIFDPVSIVATHLTAICRSSHRELVTLETVSAGLDFLAKSIPTTVGLVCAKHSLLTVRDVYRGLLAEQVSIRNQEAILNVLAGAEGSVDSLVGQCRLELRDAICSELVSSDGVLRFLSIDELSQKTMLQSLTSAGWPDGLVVKASELLQRGMVLASERGLQAIFVVHPRLRSALRPLKGSAVLLAPSELPPGLRTESQVVLSLEDELASD